LCLSLEPLLNAIEGLIMLRTLALLFVAGALLWSSHVQADDAQVSVQLAGGREFAGALDARTDDEKLWLRWTVGEVQLQRPIAWERIQSVELNGAPIEVKELRVQAARLATPGLTTQLRRASPNAPPRSSLAVSPVVRSIQCDAWLANWDSDAAFDGLALEIVALDEFGEAVPAQGTVQAELTTIDYQPAYLNSSSGGRVPTSLGRWSQRWSAQRLRLELQGRDPQRDGSLSRYAVLTVRVTIPGSGVFEQQIDGLRMRPFTPVQNALWR
jgi:hypothetical protein